MRVTMHIYVQITRMWIFEIWVLKTIFEPKNGTLAGDRRITTSFKIIRGQRQMRRGWGEMYGWQRREMHTEHLVETEVSGLFSHVLKVAESILSIVKPTRCTIFRVY
jgi:hypothetical protein